MMWQGYCCKCHDGDVALEDKKRKNVGFDNGVRSWIAMSLLDKLLLDCQRRLTSTSSRTSSASPRSSLLRSMGPETTLVLTARTACGRYHERWRETSQRRNKSTRGSKTKHSDPTLPSIEKPSTSSEYKSYITSVIWFNRCNMYYYE